MENPIILRSSTESNSPEFEFWMSRNPSFPQPDLLPADQLIVDGVLLPLHLLHHPESNPTPDPEQNPQITPSSSTTSKRWTDIFKNKIEHKIEDKSKKKEKDKKVSAESNQLNINIWPFSRSRSAGNVGIGRKSKTLTRKVSSAPCSRSNSSSESKMKKLQNSPSRTGIHLSRTSPVWQVRKSKLGGKVVENVDVPVCIGYRCKSDEYGGVSSGGNGDGGRGGGVSSNLFNLRGLFTKKVH